MRAALTAATAPRTIGRYVLFDEIAIGGMGTVHLARLLGPIGFARTVAVKQMHPHLAGEERARAMFIDEARMAARVRHPNAVPVQDVVAVDRHLFLVMDYVHGESLARLVASKGSARHPVPIPIASAILIGVLHGLHAAHEATDESGQPLGLVHRDVSPQNMLVGLDGVPRVVDFGIAKAAGRLQPTTDGQLKGKAAYLSPEQILEGVVDRRADVYGAAVVLWELLAGRRLFDGEGPASTLRQVLDPKYEPPSRYAASVPPAVDEVVLKGLAWEPGARFATAWDMAAALENVAPPASVRQVSEWVEAIAGERLRIRAKRIADIESASSRDLSEVVEARQRGTSQDDIPTQIGSDFRLATAPTSDATDVALGIPTPDVPATRSTPRFGRAQRLVAGSIVLGVLTLVAVGAYRVHERKEGAHARVEASAPSPETTATLPEATAPPSAAGASAASRPTTSPSPSPSAAPLSPAAAAKRKTPRRGPGSAGANCAVPFTWAPDGTKVPKLECL